MVFGISRIKCAFCNYSVTLHNVSKSFVCVAECGGYFLYNIKRNSMFVYVVALRAPKYTHREREKTKHVQVISTNLREKMKTV